MGHMMKLVTIPIVKKKKERENHASLLQAMTRYSFDIHPEYTREKSRRINWKSKTENQKYNVWPLDHILNDTPDPLEKKIGKGGQKIWSRMRKIMMKIIEE